MIYAHPTGTDASRLYAWAKRLVDDLNRYGTNKAGPIGPQGPAGAAASVVPGPAGPMGPTGPQGASGSAITVVTRTTSYAETATSGILVILADNAAGMTITLPSVVGNGAQIAVKKVEAAGQITLTATAGQTIDGGATAVLFNQNESVTLIPDGASNWDVI